MSHVVFSPGKHSKSFLISHELPFHFAEDLDADNDDNEGGMYCYEF